MGQTLRVARYAAGAEAVQPGAFPAFDPGVGVDTLHFTDANIVIQRRAHKLIAQRRQQLFHAVHLPAG